MSGRRADIRGRRPFLAPSMGILLLALSGSGCGTVIDGEEVLQPRVASSPAAADDPAGSEVSYSADIQPILDIYCTECHSPANLSAGVDTASHQAVVHGGLVVPGNPEGSRLLQVIAEGTMPPSSILVPTAAEVEAITSWVAAGAADN